MKISLLVVYVIGVCSATKLPTAFKKCYRGEPKFKECLKNAIQNAMSKLDKGFPEIGLPSFEPLQVPSMTIGEGTGAVDVVQNYKNVKIYGFSTIKFDGIDLNFDEKTLALSGILSEVKMVADYEMSGKVLLLPIQGKGESVVTLGNCQVDVNFNFEEVEVKERKHLKVVKNELHLHPEHIHYNFKNLFNGDKSLSDNINNVLNENSKEIFQEVIGGYESAFSAIFRGLANNVFAKVPESEIF